LLDEVRVTALDPASPKLQAGCEFTVFHREPQADLLAYPRRAARGRHGLAVVAEHVQAGAQLAGFAELGCGCQVIGAADQPQQAREHG
jgi:hypothetical protein